MSGPPQDETELYPMRWKVADTAEDLFVLHRGKAIAAMIAILLVFVLGGFSLLSDGTTDNEPSLTSPSTSSSSAAPDDDTSGSTVASSTSSQVSSSSTEQLEVVPFDRAVPDAALEDSAHGPLILVEPGGVTLAGGLSTDAEADSMLALAAAIFPNWAIEDRQQVNPGFEDSGAILARISNSDLFNVGSFEINPEYYAAIDQLAVFLVANPGSRVTVLGYGDTEADSVDQIASDRAARAAQRLRAAGVTTDAIDIVNIEESPPETPRGPAAPPGSLDFLLS